MAKTKLPSPELVKRIYEDKDLTVPQVIKKLGLAIEQKTFNKYLKQLEIQTRGKGRGNKPNRFLMSCCKHPFDCCICDGIAHG